MSRATRKIGTCRMVEGLPSNAARLKLMPLVIKKTGMKTPKPTAASKLLVELDSR